MARVEGARDRPRWVERGRGGGGVKGNCAGVRGGAYGCKGVKGEIKRCTICGY